MQSSSAIATRNESLATDVCIVGCGPAGALLGLLCARAGMDVTVVERSREFTREFRGEGITPGGVKCLIDHGVMSELPPDSYVRIQGMRLFENGERIFEASFEELLTENRLAIDIPQPTLIETIVRAAKRQENFRILMESHPVDLARDAAGRFTGLTLKGPGGKTAVKTKLIVGCDGRYSTLRKLGGFESKKRDLKRDVVWFKMQRPENWPDTYTNVRIIRGNHLIILPCYPDLLRVGLYMPKGGFGAFKKLGLENFHREIERLEPSFTGLVERHVKSWQDVSLLDIFTVEVKRWALDGLVLIGDAAHTCSPILGQGVNLALGDAVELAPLLSRLIVEQRTELVTRADLLAFERKRQGDIRFVKGFQDRNELMLSLSSALTSFLRRTIYRLMNFLPTKPWLLTRIAMGVRQLD